VQGTLLGGVRGALRRHAACAAERQREQRWQDRFKCQVLLDQAAVLAAMAYVDLNPLRAKLCDTLEASKHTSARKRLDEIAQTPALAEAKLAPIAGQRGRCVLALTEIEYLQMVDYTGRQIRADKRGAIAGPPPAILKHLGYSPDNWTRQVLAIRSDFSRAVGAVEMLAQKASAIGQFWLRGIATARRLATA